MKPIHKKNATQHITFSVGAGGLSKIPDWRKLDLLGGNLGGVPAGTTVARGPPSAELFIGRGGGIGFSLGAVSGGAFRGDPFCIDLLGGKAGAVLFVGVT